ncbi:MAG TPA: hypothetical protein VIG48_00060 [Jatrophihabitans sp.]|jgi:hypothetical protein
MHRYFARSVVFVAVPLLAGVAGAAPGTAAPARTGPAPGPAAAVIFSGDLSGVAATSARNAWAVGSGGSFSSPRILIVHWNGTGWVRVPSPAGTGGGALSGVAATSAGSAWAVGCTHCFTSSSRSLILRWNGTVWTRVPSPSPGRSSSLSGVAATSADRAWAVGTTGTTTLILRWNGTAWKRVPSPSPASNSGLSGVAATSGRNAWAVGEVVSSSSSFTHLILHWNGKAWRRVAGPLPRYGKYGNALRGVAATSDTNALAVGCTDECPVGGSPVIERWNGTGWKQVAAPTKPFGLYNLAAVAATSARSAWAVGSGGPVTDEGTAAAHWNGRAWTLSKAIAGAGLTGVAATSATNAWAVGGTVHGRTLILHWNGTTWKAA